ncbi:MAG: 4,5-DOPA dioxygenase extradiol, partial [Chloroflexota bacterium]|nr:4,5-DOPA dioxygenase extradiol [Chloroflexota bacterium]
YTEAWRAFGRSIPKPKAVLAVSAHWYINATAALATPIPRTIHDFYGFPEALYDVEYPAKGDPELAAALKELAAPIWVGLDRDSWGIDHGTWSVLVHVFPDADVPVVQLSIDATKPPEYHLELGRRLGALRDRGVLILGSGNIVHNLRTLAWGERARAYDWATRFDGDVRRYLREGDDRSIVEYERHPDGALAVPTPDHYLPLLYVAGLRRNDDDLGVLVDGVDLGSISMTAVRVG